MNKTCGLIVLVAMILSAGIGYGREDAKSRALQLDTKPEDKKIEIVDNEKLQQLQSRTGTLYVSEDGRNVYTLVPVDGTMTKKLKDYVKAYIDRQHEQ